MSRVVCPLSCIQILSCLILTFLVLSYLILHYPILPLLLRPILSYPALILSYSVLSCYYPNLSCTNPILYTDRILSCLQIISYPVCRSSSVLSCLVLFFSDLSCPILACLQAPFYSTFSYPAMQIRWGFVLLISILL